jgi:hypothetical protein
MNVTFVIGYTCVLTNQNKCHFCKDVIRDTKVTIYITNINQ